MKLFIVVAMLAISVTIAGAAVAKRDLETTTVSPADKCYNSADTCKANEELAVSATEGIHIQIDLENAEHVRMLKEACQLIVTLVRCIIDYAKVEGNCPNADVTDSWTFTVWKDFLNRPFLKLHGCASLNIAQNNDIFDQ